MKAWPKVALGELISRADETAVLDPLEQYHEVTIKLWGKGILSRGKVLGSDVVKGCRTPAINRRLIRTHRNAVGRCRTSLEGRNRVMLPLPVRSGDGLWGFE